MNISASKHQTKTNKIWFSFFHVPMQNPSNTQNYMHTTRLKQERPLQQSKTAIRDNLFREPPHLFDRRNPPTKYFWGTLHGDMLRKWKFKVGKLGRQTAETSLLHKLLLQVKYCFFCDIECTIKIAWLLVFDLSRRTQGISWSWTSRVRFSVITYAQNCVSVIKV